MNFTNLWPPLPHLSLLTSHFSYLAYRISAVYICSNMARIPQHIVDEIYRATDILEVIGDYVTLKKRGQNHWALSPFTKEKTPSFAVNPAKNIYKCFSTGKGGNTINFLIEMEGYTYVEALKHLARKYNIEIIEEEVSPEVKEQLDRRQSLFIVNGFAASFFHGQLMESEVGKRIGLSYFKERGLLEHTIKTFQLGYAPDQWDTLVKAAYEAKYQEDFLIELGLASRSGKTGNLIDRFRDRVIFPIRNPIGKFVGFGGRILSERKDVGKYINSSESQIYNKSQVVYGLFEAKQSIRNEDLCILTEGYMDTLMLHQNGIQNVVASSGTALTIEQIRLIRRFSKKVLMIYDGDAAGIKAAMRGIELLIQEEMSVKVLILPDKHDPDSYVRKFGPEALREQMNTQALDFIAFKLKVLGDREGENPSPDAQAQLIKELAKTIALVPDRVYQQVYIKQVAQELAIGEDLMMHAVEEAKGIQAKFHAQELRREQAIQRNTDQQAGTVKDLKGFEKLDLVFQEKELLRILLSYFGQSFVEEQEGPLEDEDGNPLMGEEVELVSFFKIELESLNFENQVFDQLKEELFTIHAEEREFNINTYLNHSDPAICALVAELLSIQHEISPNWRKHGAFVLDFDADLGLAVKSAMYHYKYKKVNKLIEEAQEKIKAAETNEEEVDKWLSIYLHLMQMRRSIGDKLGTAGAIQAKDASL